MSSRKNALKSRQITSFQKCIYDYYKTNGRKRLPWRKKDVTPYQIFISEIMLQQTQVDRVVQKYNEFIRIFPNITALALASFKKVFKYWQGLGYNRRAKFLHESARRIKQEFNGRIPADPVVLKTLPGVGAATASSISAFAYNTPVIFIETNIRSVFIHHFFKNRDSVPDEEIIPLIDQTLDKHNPRKWYSALMDYGTWLKRIEKNPSRKSTHYAKQSKFQGSDRQVRGRVLKLLGNHAYSLNEIIEKIHVNKSKETIYCIIEKLIEEGFIKQKQNKFYM